MDAGIINGVRKTLHPERAVATSWSGADDRDLEIIDNNPIFELYSPEYILNPWVIAQNRNQVGINNALAVDLTGQIASESVFGGQMYNGIGGQPETHIGALYSEGGRAITLLYSTALQGSISRIVPKLESGEMVTMPSFWADTIVTEYGVAHPARQKPQRAGRGPNRHRPPRLPPRSAEGRHRLAPVYVITLKIEARPTKPSLL